MQKICHHTHSSKTIGFNINATTAPCVNDKKGWELCKLNLSFQCAKDMAGFGVMFFTAFFSYAVLGYQIFGSSVSQQKSFHEFQNCKASQF